jgi:hypothetical protein
MRAGLLGGAATLLLLAGCAPDYGAVRDWAAMGAEAANYPPLPQGIAAQPARLADLGATAPAQAGRAERQAALQAMQRAAVAWLELLALMAEDGQPVARDNPLESLAQIIAPVDEAAATDVRNLGETIVYAAKRNWRAPQLAYILQPGDAPFRGVLAGLGRQVAALEPDEAAERAALAGHFRRLAAGTRDPAARAALEEAEALRRREIDGRVAARVAYLAVLARIGEGHALLIERQGKLSQAETARLVRGQEAALRRAAALLPRA